MKKLFTLTIVALFALLSGVEAQNYRYWDFTSWSDETIANLMAEAAQNRPAPGWSDIEKVADDKAGAVAPEATKDKCFWYDDNKSGELTANGVLIKELLGLHFNAAYSDNRSLAIAVNYPSTSLGEYAGPQYLWLGGGGKNVACFTIPKVPIGQKITMVVESHNPSQARGVELYVGSVDATHKIGDSFKPTLQETHTWENWTLPEGVTDEDGDGLIDMIVYNTSGCHLYSLEVGDKDQKAKIAYLYATEQDAAFDAISANENYTVDAVDVATSTVTADQLKNYSLVTVAKNIPADNAAIATIKDVLFWVPVLNMNANAYAAWGVGQSADVAGAAASIIAKNPSNRLFAETNLRGTAEDQDTKNLIGLGAFAGVKELSGFFATDDTLATAYRQNDIVAIHSHNLNHNGYLYIPFATSNDAKTIITNAASILISSKADITPLKAPTFALTFKDKKTIVSIKHTTANADIFYTIDGQTPTEQSTKYTEPITIEQEGVTVKAVAIAEGYTLSEVADTLVVLKEQAAAPVLKQSADDNKTLVSATTATEGAQIWYNFTGSADTLQSAKYTEPVAVAFVRNIYMFATAEGKVASEVTSQLVAVASAKIRIDVVNHMDANANDYNGGSTSTTYYFSWGKNKSGDSSHPYYDPESMETVPDSQGGDSIIYTRLNTEEEKVFETGWTLRSRGQLVTWEKLDTRTNIGDRTYRNPATVEDINEYFPITNNIINLADKNTLPDGASFPYNAYLVSTQKFKGPFDIVANLGNGGKNADNIEDDPEQHAVIEIASDGNAWDSNWQVLGDTVKLTGARLIRNVIRHYEAEDEVYVRVYQSDKNSKTQIYDIYIAVEGEKSAALAAQLDPSGISEVSKAVKVPAGIYNLSGVRQNIMRRGFNIIVNSDGSIKKVMMK